MPTKSLVLLMAVILLAPQARGEGPLTNQDVVKMTSARLGEDLVVAKIKQASSVEFALDVDALVALRKAGVSEKVIQAMLERKSGSTWHSSPQGTTGANGVPGNPWDDMREDLGYELVRVALRSSDGEVRIPILRGDVSSVGFAGFGAFYMNYPGLRAQVRTRDKRPSVLVKSTAPLTGGNYFLTKLDVDHDDGVRSLKISSAKAGLKAVFGKTRGITAPDPEWTIPFDSVEESTGIWRVTPQADLVPGEYGWYVDLGSTTSAQAAGIFSFGVD